LAEVGENIVVILSTHIVEDVMELCTKMAIINKGRVLYEGAPDAAVAELEGKIWQRSILKTEIDSYAANFRVISNKLVAGRPLIHVYAGDAPGEGFKPAQADLEDVFFSKINGVL
jgi:ABC-2 type transport system ATP-binding protein